MLRYIYIYTYMLGKAVAKLTKCKPETEMDGSANGCVLIKAIPALAKLPHLASEYQMRTPSS